jgi:RNA polymerase sigma factor (TIGR02999 family)
MSTPPHHAPDAVHEAGAARDALDVLLPVVYEQLRTLAHHHRRRWVGDHTLDTTALVHEAYLRLADSGRVALASRAHVLGVASKAMRSILCDYARERHAIKRGGDVPRLSLETLLEQGVPVAFSDAQSDTLAALDEALAGLASVNPRLCRVVECRFFGGLTVEETAEALGTSPATVKRDWALARAWLYRELHDDDPAADRSRGDRRDPGRTRASA